MLARGITSLDVLWYLWGTRRPFHVEVVMYRSRSVLRLYFEPSVFLGCSGPLSGLCSSCTLFNSLSIFYCRGVTTCCTLGKPCNLEEPTKLSGRNIQVFYAFYRAFKNAATVARFGRVSMLPSNSKVNILWRIQVVSRLGEM